MTTTLTTADLAAFAARQLQRLRDEADRKHLEAQLMPGAPGAWQCAQRINGLVNMCDHEQVLATLAEALGDTASATAIRDDMAATAGRLIQQAIEARQCSVPVAAQ